MVLRPYGIVNRIRMNPCPLTAVVESLLWARNHWRLLALVRTLRPSWHGATWFRLPVPIAHATRGKARRTSSLPTSRKSPEFAPRAPKNYLPFRSTIGPLTEYRRAGKVPCCAACHFRFAPYRSMADRSSRPSSSKLASSAACICSCAPLALSNSTAPSNAPRSFYQVAAPFPGGLS
jgi:hypothetical protein